MLNAIKNKIRSREGASITFALLIFLVCAIISGVVIVAGSTASGRMSQIAQTDQRYYAVTSAAGLLRDDIDGTRVTVSYDVSKPQEAAATKAVTVSVNPSTNKEVETPITLHSRKIIEDASCLLARKLAGDTSASSVAPVFTLSVSNGKIGNDASAVTVDHSFLRCQIKENVMTDGRLIFEITNPAPVSGTVKASYTLQIIFNANISKSSAQVMGTDGIIKNVDTVAVQWTFSGVKKGALA